VKIRVCITWQIVVDGQINALNINTSAKDICSYTDTLVEFFEFFVPFDA